MTSASVKLIFVLGKWKSEVAQLCPTLCDPVDCSLPGSSVHGIFQARVLEWGAISFSRGSSQTQDWTLVSRTEGRCFTVWAAREALVNGSSANKMRKGDNKVIPPISVTSFSISIMVFALKQLQNIDYTVYNIIHYTCIIFVPIRIDYLWRKPREKLVKNLGQTYHYSILLFLHSPGFLCVCINVYF